MTKITAHMCVPDLNMFLNSVSMCTGQLPEDLLNWLVFSASTLTPSGTKAVWDLNEFAGAVLKHLPKEMVDELSRPPHRARFGNYKLFYIPEKVFSINKNGSEASYYDLSQYFPGEQEPKTIIEMQEKADLLQQTLSELGIDDPPSLASPLACFRGHDLLKTLDGAFPSIFDLPDEWMDAQEIALACTPREWISNYKIGYFPDIWKYDLSSAYPWQASRLPGLLDCSVEKTERVSFTAHDGFLVGDFMVYPDHPLAFCSPFLVDRGDGALMNFVGTAHDYRCTLDDVRTLFAYEMGEFRLKYGWNICFQGKPRFPFAEVMSKLFSLRGEHPLRSHLLKRVMNGIVGQLLETRKDDSGAVIEYGKHFNPIYHAMITNPVRLNVFNELVTKGVTADELVHVGVDGFRATRQIVLPNHAPMGGWRCTGQEAVFVLSPGAIVSPDRNYKRTGYHDLLAECETRPMAYLLGEDPDDPINVRQLFLRQTRSFPKMPKNAGDLLSVYESSPVRL